MMSVPDLLLPSPPDTLHRDCIPISHLVKPAVSTPDQILTSFLPSSGTGTRKRVEFSSWNDAQEIPSSDPPSESSILRALPRSKDCHSMVRSILKPYSESEVTKFGLDGTEDGRSAVNMNSILEQLANNDKFSSVDAYQSLAQLIRTYDEVPEDSDTRSNVLKILKYIKRDLTNQDQNLSTPVDMNLATQALKVSVIFVWSENLSPLLTDDFRMFIIDRAINALVEHTVPKVVIVHYMHLLATQNFRSIMFTSGTRTGKLLEALRELTNHIQGKGALLERLLVYQKLIEQAKPIMKAKAGLWIREVLIGLTSKVKDIQERAMSVCSRICASFPMSSQISQATREALLTILKDDRTLNTTITQRLVSMIAAKDEAVQVPQIWALVMLMCNSADARLESWSYTKDWLKVLQRCFNCSDLNVKIQAFQAWNRFIYINKPHEASDSMLSMLVKPIVSQIERTSNQTSGKGTRPAAVASYCTLLYYAFRPAANFKQYTRSWNEYVVKVSTSQFLSKSTANADLCCRTLMAMFWKDPSASRIWNENRAHENRLVDPEELPTIDCKWTRSKIGPILDIFRLLFKYSAWGPSVQHSDQAFVAKAWRHLMRAIRESASKEIKQSTDTRNALIILMEFLNEVFEPRQANIDDDSMDQDQAMKYDGKMKVACDIAIAELGLKSIVDTMHSMHCQRNPAVLGELLRQALRPLCTKPLEDLARPEQQPGGRILASSTFETCWNLFSEELEQSYVDNSSNNERFNVLLDIAAEILFEFYALPVETVVQYLLPSEKGLVVLIEDKMGVYKSLSANTTLQRAWLNVSDLLVEYLGHIPILLYCKLDDLLAAVLSSSNDFTVNRMLEVWNSKLWRNERIPVYGDNMQKAISRIQQHNKFVNLPGIADHAVIKMAHDHSTMATDGETCSGLPATVQGTLQNSKPSTEARVGAAQQAQESTALSRPTLPPNNNSSAKKLTSSKNEDEPAQQRSRHDDSQVQFIPITSLPLHTEEVESQFLTERQKEVRDQQRNEPAITFADLRSSPQQRTKGSSRATSVDCEMARKVAAMEDEPATPTLSRQAENLDNEVLPSPTPKARHQKLRIADIEIPSSPPSVLGNQDDVPQEIASSPTKAANSDDENMVSLEEVQPVVEAVACGLPLNKRGRGTTLLEKFRGQAEPRPSTRDSQGQDVDMHENTDCRDPMNAVRQDVQSIEASANLHDSVTEADDPVVFGNHTIDSDELDEASASQLSQDLDWHLRREVPVSTNFAIANQDQQVVLKKRKYDTNGYTDNDRKRRRRRSLGRESLSPQSLSIRGAQSEVDENNTGAEGSNTEDYIVVQSTTKQRSSGHHVSATTPIARTPKEGTPVTSTGRRKRSKHRKSKQPSTNNVSHESLESSNQATGDLNGTEETNHEFHTPTPSRMRAENNTKTTAQQQEVITNNNKPNGHDLTPTPQTQQTLIPDIMTALQTALNSLKHGKQTDIDLRAIDDLCFQIRYQAQENAQKRV